MSERPNDPRSRPPDPAGTRPKFDPDALRPAAGSDFRALPAGEPVLGGERLPQPRREGGALVAAHGGAPSQHAPRFQFLLGALGALAVAAIAFAVSLALAPATRPGPPWSVWKPSGDADPAVQIAEHVAPEYASSPGHPLVRVTGGPPQFAGQPAVVALRRSGTEPVALENNGVLYQLCGSGPDCSIPGKPSLARGLLVRREALELALYTFHYVGSASQVIVTYPPLPPAKGAKSPSEEAFGPTATQPRGRALLFRPADLAPELAQPLSATLSSQAPTAATIERMPEARLVDQLTGSLVYNFEVTMQQQTPVLLLQAPTGS